MRSPISAKEVLGILQRTDPDPSSLSQHDPRWARLHVQEMLDVDHCDRFRCPLIGGGIEDAMGRPKDEVWPFLAHPGRPLL